MGPKINVMERVKKILTFEVHLNKALLKQETRAPKSSPPVRRQPSRHP
jgi:hypothetical protein